MADRLRQAVKVNIGCGATPTDGWANFDNSLAVRIGRWPALAQALRSVRILNVESYRFAMLASDLGVRFANAAARIPCADGSVEAVYSSHMIEHLDRGEAEAFLLEVRRVLMPGGVVRLAAPDLGHFVESYVTTGDADEFMAGINVSLARPLRPSVRIKWALIGPRNHLWMYDGRSLTQLLSNAGFTSPAVMPPGKTNIMDPGALDLEERAGESVYVEAFQPV
jgi:hypothetical protein